MDRQEHLEWCKKRALEYVDKGDMSQAFASMLSDLRKHPETADHPAMEMGAQMMFANLLGTSGEMRDFINGFN